MPQFAALPSTSFPCTSVAYARSTVAQAIVERLHAARIRHVIYVPGGPMMPFISTAFQSGYFRFILCRHEQGAGFMAEGLARATRRPALVAVTAGPRVTNLVTPVYVAQREMTPVFVLSADVARHANGKRCGTGVGHGEPVETDHQTQRSDSRREPRVTHRRRAFERKRERSPRPGALEHRRLSVVGGNMLNESKVVTDCRALKDALLRAARPLLVVGYGAVLAGAAAQVLLMAGRLPQLRVAATPKAKGIFPRATRSTWV